MSEAPNNGWQELQLPSRKECPKLFYQLSTEDSSLTLLLTDLISIWECSLDKYDILAQAARQHVSIDPSESPAQFDVLLTKLRLSLQEGGNSLTRETNSRSQALLLHTRIDLPRPLKPLNWTFTLAQQNASELAERLLRPSLHEVAVDQDKINSLLRVIKDKDHVISRLLDSLGNSAVDLGLIFPSVTGYGSRKGGGVSVNDAKKHVPGMAGFDEKSWINRFAKEDGYEGADRTGLTNLVSGCEKCFVHTRAQHDDWLRNLSAADKPDGITTGSKTTSSRADTRNKHNIDKDESTDSDNDFERQPTPPSLRTKTTQSRSKQAASTNTDDEDEPEPAPKRAEIGGLGRRQATKAFNTSAKKHHDQPSSSVEPPSSPPKTRASRANEKADAEVREDTASGSDDEIISLPSRKSKGDKEIKTTPTKSALKKRLGDLHKRRNISPTPAEPPASPQPAKAPSRSPSATPTPSPSPSPSPQRQANKPKLQQKATPSPSPPAAANFTKQSNKSTPSSRHRLGHLTKNESVTPTKPSTINEGEGGVEDQNNQNDNDSDEDDDLDGSDPPSKTRSSNTQALRSPSPTQQQTQTQTPSRRLGRLGRKNPSQSQSQSQSQINSPSKPNPGSSSKKKPPSHDVEMKDLDDDDDATSSPSPSPSRLHPNSPPAPTARTRTRTAKEAQEQEQAEETASQKADRRRAELKRSLVANAGAKKKRRF